MKTKARSDSIRKRKNIEEKYSWDRLSDSDYERKSHKVRALIATVVVISLFLLYMVKLYQVQVSSHEYYTVKSDSNRIKIRPIQATRGIIYDRKGNILADNISTFNLIVKKEMIGNKKDFLDKLEKLVRLDETMIDNINSQYKNRRLKDITIIEDITLDDYSRIAVDQHILPTIELSPRSKRRYNSPESISHLMGYVGKVSNDDLDSSVVKIHEGMTEIGKLGVERFYQNILSGQPGFEKLETDAKGEVIRILEKRDPIRGRDVVLTIDLELQNFIYKKVKKKEGAVIVMDPNNGDILAFVSFPGYDINLFTKSISNKKYQSLLNDERRPLINRATSGQYPPGSTLKPFIGMIALEQGIIDETKHVNCDGAYELGNHKRPFRCWKKDGHGDADLSYALTQSCDVFFYRVAELTGIDLISEQLYKYGFGQKTYLDLYGEKAGLVPDRQWKSKTKALPWYPGETLNVGIGQGYFLATPMQLTLATASLANDGNTYTPHLLLGDKNNKTNEVSVYNYENNKFYTAMKDPHHLHIVKNAMWRVVNEKRVGTASHLKKVKNIEYAGKTGTAQVYNLDKGKTGTKSLQDHALFISYAPFESPEIVVTVVVENGGGGSTTAAPIARDIIEYYMDKKPTSVSMHE
ncbi:MAG: penicillin-binding protein 2 [Gammaproteobacteria bacterium]|nr:penicillin-binding protein 2 [Gammaproteobacteria bacterium]MBT6734325.1 penicillin-binding protein 2 [Gammaproteobacteria bacterium]MBT7236798.1 penicillin-binding protein 2 [Gammaproteobacteria bacterium]|tara:strand:+ start:2089 stop:3999 length:1911 start_codon:yes stop_codon:yes gene_type:complete